MKQKGKTLGKVAFESAKDKSSQLVWIDLMESTRGLYEKIARAVVREHERRKGVCSCDKETQAWANWVALPDWKYCPKCGKRIKVGK